MGKRWLPFLWLRFVTVSKVLHRCHEISAQVLWLVEDSKLSLFESFFLLSARFEKKCFHMTFSHWIFHRAAFCSYRFFQCEKITWKIILCWTLSSSFPYWPNSALILSKISFRSLSFLVCMRNTTLRRLKHRDCTVDRTLLTSESSQQKNLCISNASIYYSWYSLWGHPGKIMREQKRWNCPC